MALWNYERDSWEIWTRQTNLEDRPGLVFMVRDQKEVPQAEEKPQAESYLHKYGAFF